jgi:hypothetical protein
MNVVIVGNADYIIFEKYELNGNNFVLIDERIMSIAQPSHVFTGHITAKQD